MGSKPSTAPLPAPDVAARSPRAADAAHPRPVDEPASGTVAEPAGRIERLAWRGCVAVLGVWALSYLWWPFSNDQGNLAWVGEVIRSGGMPYRDAWDVKGPGAHLLFALAGALFGRNEWGVRLFDLMLLGAGAVAIWRIAQRYGGERSGRWATVIFLLWYASLGHHDTAQPDGWAAVMLTGAVALIIARADRPAPRAGAAAGTLIAACALVKPTYALFMALPLLEGAAHIRTAPRARVVTFAGAALLGFVLPIALCIAWFAARGALGDWIDVHLRWIPTSYAQLDAAWLNRFHFLATFLTTERFAPSLALAVGGLIVVRRSGGGRDAVLLGAWASLACLGVLIQGQFYPYHWLPAYPALATLAGLGMHHLIRSWRASAAARRDAGPAPVATLVSVAVAVVVLVGAVIGPAAYVYRLAKYAAGLGDSRAFGRPVFGPYSHHGGEFPEVIAHLRSHSEPRDLVVVWGNYAGINYLSGRASPSPFASVQPLVDPPDSALRQRYRSEFLRRLALTPPLYVVSLNEQVCERAPSPDERRAMGRAERIMRCLGDVPGVRDYVLARYDVERVIGSLEIRRRRR